MKIWLSLIIVAVSFAAPPDIKVTRWVSPDNSKPLSFREWRENQNITETWNITPLYLPTNKLDTRVDLLIQNSLVSQITPQIDTFVADLSQENYAPAVYAVTSNSAESLRNFLITEYQSGMVSAVLVGNLPTAWFQMIDDWNNNGIRESDEGYEEFPCELYFMDLNGTWEDNFIRLDTLDSLVPGTDGIYDTHYGDMSPEISISRMPAGIVGNPILNLRSYFSKDHRYRNAQLPVQDRALVYVDDDWVPWANQWDVDLGMVYSDRVLISDIEQTRAIDYRPRIDSAAYQWIGLFAHSWPGGHGWKYNNGQDWDWFYASEIPSINPTAVFYNLFACSNARFVEDGFCGGRYVFNTTTGLASIGSTKTGSMLEFQDFYSQLAVGKTLGEAFREWFVARISDGFELSEKSWFYGMCVIGDGLLKTHIPLDVGVSSIITPSGALDSGSVVTPQVKVKNFGNARVDFSVILRIGTGYEDTRDVYGLNPSDSAIVSFNLWTARPLGTQTTRCTTLLTSDANSFNDLLIDSVVVVPGPGIADNRTKLVPVKLGLANIAPNPFIEQTVISLAIPKQGKVDLAIYNGSGKLVRTLKSGNTQSGIYNLLWDGTDNQNQSTPDGIYFIRLKAGTWQATEKLIKLQ